MELGILLLILIWTFKALCYRPSVTSSPTNSQSEIRIPKSQIRLTALLLSLFLGILVIQMIPLPEAIIKTISPKTYEIRDRLTVISSLKSYESRATKSEIRIPNSEIPFTHESGLMKSEFRNPQSKISNLQSKIRNPKSRITLSFFPFATKVHFFRWLTLAGLFIFLLNWRLSDNRYRITQHLIIAIFLVGVFESLYGMFEFFSGRHHIFHLDMSRWTDSGRQINRAGSWAGAIGSPPSTERPFFSDSV
jgi:hypothetical protein